MSAGRPRHLVGEMARRLDQGPVGQNLLPELVERCVACRIVKRPRLAGLLAEQGKEIVLGLRHAEPEVAIFGAHHDRNHLAGTRRKCCLGRSGEEPSVEDRPGDPGTGFPFARPARTSSAEAPSTSFSGGSARSAVSARASSPSMPSERA